MRVERKYFMESPTRIVIIGGGFAGTAIALRLERTFRRDSSVEITLVDSENYRQRREDFLIQMALRMGDKAKKIRKPVSTNLLNPHDRRIVHLALRDDDELGTKGRGEGILKKVIIIPKRYNSSRSPKRET